MWKKQQDRKKRKANRPVDSRSFRTNDDLSYISIPEVTFSGDFEIEFDVFVFDSSVPGIIIGNSSDNTNNGIFINTNNLFVRDNAGSTTNTTGGAFASNIFNRVRIVKEGTAVAIFVNGVQEGSGTSSAAFIFDRLCTRRPINELELNGILANVRMYDNGTLVRNYPINDNSNTIADISGNGQDGSVVNGNASDWELFNQQADGDYLGQNLLPQINFLAGQGWLTSSLAVRGTETEFSVTALGGLAYDNLLQVGNEYRLRIAANNTPDTFQAWNSLLVAGNLIGNITSYISTYDFTALDDALYLRTTEAASYQNVELDIKRLLRTA